MSWKKGSKHTKETKNKISISLMRENNFNFGKHFSKEHKRKISISNIGKHYPSNESRIKMSMAKLGKHNSIEHNKNISKVTKLDKNPAWKGGKSFEQYGLKFNKEFKEKIRKRDNFRCQQCFRGQDELRRKLCIHHIDFNKKNNNENNLISLCDNCHSQTNFNRDNWINYFQERVIK